VGGRGKEEGQEEFLSLSMWKYWREVQRAE